MEGSLGQCRAVSGPCTGMNCFVTEHLLFLMGGASISFLDASRQWMGHAFDTCRCRVQLRATSSTFTQQASTGSSTGQQELHLMFGNLYRYGKVPHVP
jgi:hypothetical protein